MPTIRTHDGTEIFYKDWGSGPPHVPPRLAPQLGRLGPQLMFFSVRGYRVIAHDRRGHGRSSQTSDGHDMDHYAADAAAVVEHLDLQDVVHVGHSTGGGEVARYVARHGAGRVSKAVLISAVPPLMLQADAKPAGPSSSSTSLQDPSTGSTDPARRYPRGSSGTGGAKA